MVKTLRLFLVAALAMVGLNAMAEDIIWQEDFSSYKAGDVPTGGTYSYTCVDGGSATKIFAENLAGGTAPELLVGKKGSGKTGSFTAVIPLNGKSGSMSLSFKQNYDRLDVAVTGATLGEKANSGTTYEYPIEVASGTTSITISFTINSTSNVRLDDIKLYQGTAKKPAGLSWGKASTTVTYGDTESYEKYLPTLQNGNNLSITCTSSDEKVATVTNAGVITVVGVGKATISATFEGNEEYEAQSVSIEITVQAAINPDEKGQQNNPYLLTDDDFAKLVNDLKPEDASSTDPANKKSAKIYIKGFIVNIESVLETDLAQYGNMTFKIAATKGDQDAEVKLKAYRCYYLENKKFTSADQIKLGDEVVINGQIQWYGGAPQVASGCHIFSLNGETTGINELKAQNAQFEGKIYNLAGQVVNKAYKGMVIMNGKKFINK